MLHFSLIILNNSDFDIFHIKYNMMRKGTLFYNIQPLAQDKISPFSRLNGDWIIYSCWQTHVLHIVYYESLLILKDSCNKYKNALTRNMTAFNSVSESMRYNCFIIKRTQLLIRTVLKPMSFVHICWEGYIGYF